jgi:serine/threonine-protein kinase HipA
MLIARYDRTLIESQGKRYLRRVHQEDFCQALGRYPREKYEKDGGPGWAECFTLMGLTEEPATARQELLGRAVFQSLFADGTCQPVLTGMLL